MDWMWDSAEALFVAIELELDELADARGLDFFEAEGAERAGGRHRLAGPELRAST